MSFGSTIKRLRVGKKLSMADVAKALGLDTRSSVWNWEKDLNLPSTDNLFKIADLYGVDVRFLNDLARSQRESLSAPPG